MALMAGTWLEPQLHPGELLRSLDAAMLGSPIGTFAGGVGATNPAHGVVSAGDLAVTANGTPNLSVNVAAGAFFIRGTEGPTQGAYFNVNTAPVNVTGVPTGNGTNPTWHLLIVRARNQGNGYGAGVSDDFRFDIVPGTPSPTPSDPSLTGYPNALPLARIVMPTGSSNVGGGAGQGTIVDLRSRVPGMNGEIICTSTTRPAVFSKGTRIYETNTGLHLRYYGATTGWQKEWGSAWGHVYSGGATASASTVANNLVRILSWDDVPVLKDRKLLVQYAGSLENSSTGDGFNLTLRSPVGTIDTGRTIGIAQPRYPTAGEWDSTSSGTLSFGLNAQRISGSTAVLGPLAGFGQPLIITDIGPATGVNAPTD